MDIIIETQNTKQEYKSVLKEYYARYLIDVRGLSKSSVRHYFDALNNISNRLKEKNLVKVDIYEITDLEQLKQVKEILYADMDFIALNKRGNQMYSAELNNYYRFASGEDFKKVREKVQFLQLDVPMLIKDPKAVEYTTYKRSNIIRTQAIEFANYSCEINGSHETFIAESTNKPYMEGHHAIPMRFQPQFNNSLDVYANIVCLCLICHRKIHYGLKDDRKQMMNQIYVERSDRLVNSGIILSKEEFVNLVVAV